MGQLRASGISDLFFVKRAALGLLTLGCIIALLTAGSIAVAGRKCRLVCLLTVLTLAAEIRRSYFL